MWILYLSSILIPSIVCSSREFLLVSRILGPRPSIRKAYSGVQVGMESNEMRVWCRKLVESIRQGLGNKMTVLRKLVESIGHGLGNRMAVLRLLVESDARDFDNKRIVFRGKQFVQAIGQGLTFILASILLNLISNRVSDVEPKHFSWLETFVHYIPMSFLHYLPLTITTLILWCIGNRFFLKFQDLGRLPLVGGPSHPQITALPHPQIAGPSHAQLIARPSHPQVVQCQDFMVIGSPETQVTGPPHPQVIRPTDPQVPGPFVPQGTEPPDLGILDNDLRLFFHHLKQDYRLPAPAMLPTSAIESISWAQASSGSMALTVHIKGVVTDVEVVYKPVVTLPSGSKVLYRRFELGPQTGDFELEDLRKLVLESMSRAQILDPGCTLQFGSFAVLKYTESGLKWWRLEKHWTPTISDIRQSPWNILASLSGSSRKWIVRGYNLQTAMLKASTVDKIENLKVFHHYKVESGEEVLCCEEPQIVRNSAPTFQKEVYICASNSVSIQDGVIFDIQSEPVIVKRAYWISVMESLIPSLWTMSMTLSLSLFGALDRGTHGRYDDLLPKFAWGHLDFPFRTFQHFKQVLQHDGDVNIIRVDLDGNTILSDTLSELYKFFLVYMFVIVIPNVVLKLWQFSHGQIPQSDSDLPGLRRRASLENTTRIPNPTFPPIVEDLLEDTPGSATPSLENNWLEDITSDPSLTTQATQSVDENNVVEDITSGSSITTQAPLAETYVGFQEEEFKSLPGVLLSNSSKRERDNDDHSSKRFWWRSFWSSGNQSKKTIQRRSIKKVWRRIFKREKPMRQIQGLPERFGIRQLFLATEGFSKESLIGCGAYGSVYRGVLPSGTLVAVKRLSKQRGSGYEEFIAELSALSQLRHRNVIQLLGWSEDAARKEVILVYEFMPNGSLSAILHKQGRGTTCLSWHQRFKILTGIATALEYLHCGCEKHVLHRDVKSSNILLDEDWNAKLSDFGLARLVDLKEDGGTLGCIAPELLRSDRHLVGSESEGNTITVAGTCGYLAPEILRSGRVTHKGDVFGFGIVVLEVVSGHKAVDFSRHPIGLVDWVRIRMSEGDLLNVVDERLGDYDTHWMEVVLKLGLLCSQDDPLARPSMRKVVQVLAGDVSVPSVPFSQVLAGLSSSNTNDLKVAQVAKRRSEIAKLLELPTSKVQIKSLFDREEGTFQMSWTNKSWTLSMY